MYHRVRRKMIFIFSAILVLSSPSYAFPKSLDSTDKYSNPGAIDDLENNVIDFDEDYSVTFNKKYGLVPWHGGDNFNKESHRYTLVKEDLNGYSGKFFDDRNSENKSNPNENIEQKINKTIDKNTNETKHNVELTTQKVIGDEITTQDFSVIPLELISTTENILISILESTTEPDLTVIPLSTTQKIATILEIKETVTLPSSTQTSDTTTEDYNITTEKVETTVNYENITDINTTEQPTTDNTADINTTILQSKIIKVTDVDNVTLKSMNSELIRNDAKIISNSTNNNLSDIKPGNKTLVELREKKHVKNITKSSDDLKTNSTKQIEIINRSDVSSTESEEEIPIFTELDLEDQSDVPEDYYDSKDIVPTKAPSTDALSVIFGLAGSVVESMVESVAERVVPKGIFDLFKRMQRQSEALEAEKLRSREENGGLGQFGRGILKTISTGLSKPLSQLMAGARDIGSLDSDRGFVGSLASGVASGVTSVANVANTVLDAFKDRVQAIYPGTVWCGDGRSMTARSSDLGLFFFTDTCCRQHDACKLYIKAGETKYGLTNTGLFTRSHCSCDAKFRDCLQKTNSLVSAQIGLTYFNVLGPQCFRRTHPIVRCIRRTRITGQKCEEYELDYTKPKMWQWFDNETF